MGALYGNSFGSTCSILTQKLIKLSIPRCSLVPHAIAVVKVNRCNLTYRTSILNVFVDFLIFFYLVPKKCFFRVPKDSVFSSVPKDEVFFIIFADVIMCSARKPSAFTPTPLRGTPWTLRSLPRSFRKVPRRELRDMSCPQMPEYIRLVSTLRGSETPRRHRMPGNGAFPKVPASVNTDAKRKWPIWHERYVPSSNTPETVITLRTVRDGLRKCQR